MPEWIDPTVTTAVSAGAISRATMLCSRVTMVAASTTGSTLSWGMEPWEPFPKTFTRMEAAAVKKAPEVLPTCPAGISDSTC